ncbi:MAG: deoxyribodipyrimidine photo-lyase [Ignavibacteriae bacterium]|nr:deoxyribodipyrimidine photo-lyase [Ignavibacteriota bacterium]MCB9243024.1 deoxyribodipyrimidine photo-lyase [Ignavibacteriales bacterium]
MLKIFWFRKDLRIEDNAGLKLFIENITEDDEYLFLYIKNENTYKYFGEKRIYFLCQALRSLENALTERSLKLNIVTGSSSEVFKKIIGKAGKVRVSANEQPEPYSKKRDNEVEEILKKNGGEFTLTADSTIFKLGEILKDNGTPYVVYTPFMKSFYNRLSKDDYAKCNYDFKKLSKAKEFKLSGLKSTDPGKEMKSLNGAEVFDGSRAEGLKQLKKFWDSKLARYKSRRDFPALDGTSKLSPHLHFGTVGIREAFRTGFNRLSKSSGQDLAEAKTWINELIWREFYYNITYHFPDIIKKSFVQKYDTLKWNLNKKDLTAWCEGKTGYPIVDAGMRQLVQEGWMHNRVRMITAMFLTKDLLIDWRKGERFFADHLIDLDFSSNNGGWQWSASTGVDAAPYFRIFNPVLQSKKFDKDGDYIKKYVPELTPLPGKFIHAPWEMSSEEQKKYGVVIGNDYPKPIVDHSKARDIAIKEYKAVS